MRDNPNYTAVKDVVSTDSSRRATTLIDKDSSRQVCNAKGARLISFCRLESANMIRSEKDALAKGSQPLLHYLGRDEEEAIQRFDLRAPSLGMI